MAKKFEVNCHDTPGIISGWPDFGFGILNQLCDRYCFKQNEYDYDKCISDQSAACCRNQRPN